MTPVPLWSPDIVPLALSIVNHKWNPPCGWFPENLCVRRLLKCLSRTNITPRTYSRQPHNCPAFWTFSFHFRSQKDVNCNSVFSFQKFSCFHFLFSFSFGHFMHLLNRPFCAVPVVNLVASSFSPPKIFLFFELSQSGLFVFDTKRPDTSVTTMAGVDSGSTL